MILLCTVLIVLVSKGQYSKREFTLGDFSGVSVAQAEETFEDTGETEDLLTLLKVLCYHAVVEGEVSSEEKIAHYGTILYDRAKDGQVDLSTLGPDEEMSELLSWIRSFGAR